MREAVIDYLVNAAWQLPLIATGAWALSRALSAPAARRAWLWSGFLGLALVLPLRLHPIALPTSLGLGAKAADATLPAVASAPPTVVDAAPAAVSAMPHAPSFAIDPQLAQIALLIAAGAALVALTRLVIGLAAARRLVRTSEPATLAGPVAEALARFCARHAIRRPQVRVSIAVGGPVTVGALDPVILLPAGFSRLPLEEARAAVLHEAAHIQRGDYAANLIAEVATLPLAWHPALYPLKSGLRQAREAACDALAAREMASPQAYAECLVSLARKAAPAPAAVAALAMFGEGPLEGRVRALLAGRPGRFSGLRNAAASALVLAGVAAPALLLHVTPSVAEAREVSRVAPVAPVAQAPLPPPVPSAPAARPVQPVQPPQPPAPIPPSDNEQIVINGHGKHYRHSWVMPDGHRLTVFTSDAREPTPEEQRHIEQQLADARVQIEKAKAQIAKARVQVEAEVARSHVEIERAQQQLAQARAQLSDRQMAEVQRAIAQAQAKLNDPEIQRRLQRAAQEVNSEKVRQKLDRAAAALADPEHHGGIIIENDADEPK